MKFVKLLAVASVIWIAAGCASTSEEPGITPQTVSISEYRTFLDELDFAIEEGVPRELSERERNQYNIVTRELRRELDGHETIETMDEEDRARVFTLHENLRGVLTGDRSTLVICKSERSIGSHLKTTQCMTRGEWDRREREVDQLFNNGYGFGSGMTGPTDG